MNGAGKNRIFTHKEIKFDLYLIPYTEINWKYIKELNVRLKLSNSRRKHKGKIIDNGLSKKFLDMTPKAEATEAKIN